jgi:hypothetical protein
MAHFASLFYRVIAMACCMKSVGQEIISKRETLFHHNVWISSLSSSRHDCHYSIGSLSHFVASSNCCYDIGLQLDEPHQFNDIARNQNTISQTNCSIK